MHNFDYFAPTELSEAVALLSKYGDRAKPFTGGTDQMRLRKHEPEAIVDIKKIDELNALEVTPQELRLGAAVSCGRV